MFYKTIKRCFAAALGVLLLLPLFCHSAFAAEKPSQAGEKVLNGGQRDFLWPVPDNYGISGCFLDNRRHYAIDISANGGTPVVASYRGTVVATFSGCTHNYGKTRNCCNDGFGNYVVLQHDYTLKNGSHITLYSRYSHLTAVTVHAGQTVTAGQKVGTVGSTGYSNGDHLDFQILYGGWSPFRTYSVDPYINELLEMPDGLYCASTPSCCGVGPTGCCCFYYIKYVKALYPSCTHPNFTAAGSCESCGYTFDWRTTADGSALGSYAVTQDTVIAPLPYAAAQTGQTLTPGSQVTVTALVTNGADQQWYQLADNAGFVPASALALQAFLDSQYSCTLSLPAEGQVLQQQSYSLAGTLVSRYPLRKVNGYIDGVLYGTWTNSGPGTTVELGNSAINTKLQFASLAPGDHTLTITATDSTGREETTVLVRNFQTEAPQRVVHTVHLDALGGDCEQTQLVVETGSAIGSLPTAEKTGYRFTGWFTANGELVAENTAVHGDMILTAGWEPEFYTVTAANQQLQVAYGQTVSLLAPEKAGYTLSGWVDPDGNPFLPDTPITADITLQPVWEPVWYRITLDAQGGSFAGRYRTVTYDQAYGSLPVPEKEGHRFLGWYLDGAPVTEQSLVSLPQDHTLIAMWEEIPVTPEPTQAPVPMTMHQEKPIWPWIAIGAVVVLTCAATIMIVAKKKQKETA